MPVEKFGEKRQPIRELIAGSEAEKAREAWRAKWREEGRYNTVPWCWLSSKTIEVFVMPGVDGETARIVVDALEKFKKELGLDFKLVMGKVEEVSPFVEASMEKGRFGCEEFINKWYGFCQKKRGRHTAALLLLECSLVEADRGAIYGWSRGFWPVCALSGAITKSKDENLIERAVRHEVSHLIGYYVHHDNYAQTDFGKAYPQVDDCLMLWQCSTPRICERCSDAIKAIWGGAEDAIKESKRQP